MSVATLLQIAGSLLLLMPFVLVQLHGMRSSAITYGVLNLIGSGTLALDALHGHQWGLLLLEETCALVGVRPGARVEGAGRGPRVAGD
jgi:hypothetical protein